MPEQFDDIAAALLRHPYGIFLVGSRAGDDRNLMTANWGTQCSFEPRLYTVFIEKDAHTRRLMDAGGVFSVCLLPPNSEEAASQFSKPAALIEGKLGGFDTFDGPATGAPILAGCPGWWECRIVDSRETGDHVQYVGEVLAGGMGPDARAWTLQELGWEYGG